MATISKASQNRTGFFNSIVTKLSALFIAIIAVLLVLINTYFLTASRNMMFTSKQTSLETQASVISTSLSALDHLSKENVSQVFDILEVRDFARVIVVDPSGEELYSSRKDNDNISDSQIEEHLQRALSGRDIFYSRFYNDAFSSSISVPVMIGGSAAGAFCLSELDKDQGAVLIGLQDSARNLSIIIAALTIIATLIVIMVTRRRISKIMDAIIMVREGEYEYRIRVTGNDELTRLSSEFNDLTSRLQETEERRQQFVADASHELKTPLASIRLLSDSILQNDTMTEEMAREFITDIGNEASRLARTTEKLISLTRLDNDIVPDRSRIDLAEHIRSTLRLLQPLADERDMNISAEIEPNCFVYASDDELRHITLNLIENAIKYNFDGGKVGITLKNTDGFVHFAVEDTGVGIPEDDLPRIFDRFYRVDKARSRAAGGSGLGLAIVRSTVDELGAHISAERRPEGGMRFTVDFPVYTDQEPETTDIQNNAE